MMLKKITLSLFVLVMLAAAPAKTTTVTFADITGQPDAQAEAAVSACVASDPAGALQASERPGSGGIDPWCECYCGSERPCCRCPPPPSTSFVAFTIAFTASPAKCTATDRAVCTP